MKDFLRNKLKNILLLTIFFLCNTAQASIAIFNFKSPNISAGQLKEFSSDLRYKLGDIAIVLEERDMQNILKSKGKELTKDDGQDSIIKLGKILNATDLIFGNIEKTSTESYSFNVKIIHFNELDYDKKSLQVNISSNDLIKCVKKLTDKIAEKLPVYLLTGRIIKIEKDSIYVSLGKLKVKEEMMLNIFHSEDTIISDSKGTKYEETGMVIVKKVLGDTLAIVSNIGKCQVGDFVKIGSYGLGRTQFTTTPFAAVEIKPSLLESFRPAFPQSVPSINGKCIEGTVFLSIIVDTTGSVSDAKIIKSLHPAYDSCALEAVKKWKFSPAKQKGKSVKVSMEIPIRFTLQDIQDNK